MMHVEAGVPAWGPSPTTRHRGAFEPYVEAIRAHALFAFLVLGATVLASVLWLTLRAPEYRAAAEVLVTPLPAENVALLGLPVLQDLREPTRTIQTAAALVESATAAARTARALGPPWTPSKVESAVDVQPKGETNILAVSGVAESPQLAARLANTFATTALATRRDVLRQAAREALPDLRARRAELGVTGSGATELQTAITRLESLAAGRDPTLSIAQKATPPASALGPPGWVVLALAILAGSVLAVVAAVAMDRITPPRITSEEDLFGIYPLPILARVPIHPKQQRGELKLDVDPVTREALRSVRAQLELGGESPRTVMITSPSPSDGKTTTSLALATSMADDGSRVILIDTDIRRRPIRTGLEGDAGTAVPVKLKRRTNPHAPIAERTRPSLRPLLRRVKGHPNLQLLDAMDVGFDMSDPGSKDRMADVVREAVKDANYVVLDTPPIAVVSDALSLLELVDDVIIVVQMRSTGRLHVEVARDLLARAGVWPTGYIVIGERTVGAYPYPIAPR